jgi:hypothetical protein
MSQHVWIYHNNNNNISGNNTRTTLNRFTTKTAILGTSHIIRKVIQAETEWWGSPLTQEDKYQGKENL